MSSFTISIILIIVLFIVAFVRWRQAYWTRRGLKQLNTEFLIGNFRKIITGQVSMNEAFVDFYWQFKRMGEKHGGIYSFLEPIYVPVDLGIVKNILQKDFAHFLGHGFYHDASDVLSMHVFNLEGEPWKKLRSKLTPTFSSGKIKSMTDVLVEKGMGLQRLMARFSEKSEPVSIKDVLSRYTIDVIGNCAFGIECNSLEEEECNFRKAGLKALEMKLHFFIIVALAPWSLLRAIKFNFTPREVTTFFSKLVKDTISYRETNNISRKDFLDLLLQMKNKSDNIANNDGLTENEIIAQCYIFFLGGFETSSTTMTFALLELAQNIPIQEKLREEVHRVLNKYEGKLCYEAFAEMTYLEKVIYETLRKYPPLATLPRRCTKDYLVPGTDVIIQKGIMVEIPVWAIQRDPDYYPNPDVFNPENFNEENKAARPEFTFLPFGEGPRMCLGLRFGMLQTKIGLVSLITKFKLTINEKTPLPITIDKNFILSVKGDVWLNVEKI